jgi:hypothetical protein
MKLACLRGALNGSGEYGTVDNLAKIPTAIKVFLDRFKGKGYWLLPAASRSASISRRVFTPGTAAINEVGEIVFAIIDLPAVRHLPGPDASLFGG